jgi:hypothetical protein
MIFASSRWDESEVVMFLPQSEPRYALQIRVPMSFANSLKQVAAREMTTLSGLIRQTLIDRLKAAGTDLAAGDISER